MKVKSESEVTQSCPTLRDPMDGSPPGFLRPWDFPGKSTGVGCHCTVVVKISEHHVPAGPFHLTHDTVGGWGQYNRK